MKTVLIISSLFLLFACTNHGADKNQHTKELKKDTIRNGFELHQYKDIDCLTIYSRGEIYKLFLQDTVYDELGTRISKINTTKHLDTITLDIRSPYMDECYFQIANYVNEPILYRVHIKTHFHDKIDIQDHYPNKELSKLNDMYQIYQDLWEKYEITNSKKEISFDDLEEVSLPFCIKGSYVKDDLYYVDIDKFLGFHKLKKSLNKEVNALFHKGTIDFITNEEVLIAYPYYQESEDSPPFAVKKIQINDSITTVLYGYIRVNEYSVPRIELQTFDKQGNYIDSIILYYRLADECSGERTFCIDKNFKIKIQTEFGCTAIEKDDEDFNFEQTDTFKITETGKIVRE